MAKPHQVFVGCPFSRDVRATYDRLKRELEAETPLAIVLADTVGVSSSDYLLIHITELISDSAACVFDATGANPNVSLEVGIAHTVPVDFILTLKTRKPRAKSTSAGKPRDADVRSIISDLQGKNRLEYKVYESLKIQLAERYLDRLPYMKRWRRFERENKTLAPFVARFFADIRSSGRSTRSRLEAILEGSGFSAGTTTRLLTKARLVLVRRGRDGGYFYPAS